MSSFLDSLSTSLEPIAPYMTGVGVVVVGIYALRLVLYIALQVSDVLRYACCSEASYAGKLVVVTGASSGIGKATAVSFAKKGAKVVVVARRQKKLEALRDSCVEAGMSGTILPFPCDCTEGEKVSELAKKVMAEHGAPHAIITCAAFGGWGYVHTQAHTEIDRAVKAPLLATAHTVRAFLPAMLADTKEIRQIVVPMSPVAFFNWPAATMYSANRAGLLGFTKALQQDMYGSHVQVKLATFGEADTGYWAAHPNARQYVPWISRTGIIPTLSSEFCGECITCQVLLQRGDLVQNFEISLLIECMSICPAVIEWCMRWFRSQPPGLGAQDGNFEQLE